MLEHGELKVELFHQMNPSDVDEKQKIVDIPLCVSSISLRDLIFRHTGMKGWFPLVSVQRQETAEITERCVAGLELFIRFAQQDDRRRILDSAKALGWADGNAFDDEHFLDGKIRLAVSSFIFRLLRSKRSRLSRYGVDRSNSISCSSRLSTGKRSNR